MLMGRTAKQPRECICSTSVAQSNELSCLKPTHSKRPHNIPCLQRIHARLRANEATRTETETARPSSLSKVSVSYRGRVKGSGARPGAGGRRPRVRFAAIVRAFPFRMLSLPHIRTLPLQASTFVLRRERPTEVRRALISLLPLHLPDALRNARSSAGCAFTR